MIFKTKLGKYLGRKSIKNLTCCAMILATLQAPAFCEKHRAAIKSVHNELSIVNVNKSNWYPLYHLASPAYVMKQPTAFSAFGPNRTAKYCFILVFIKSKSRAAFLIISTGNGSTPIENFQTYVPLFSYIIRIISVHVIN